MEPGTTVTLKMRPEKYKFLNSIKHQCHKKSSYYECLGAKLAEKFEKYQEKYGSNLCPKEAKKCSPFPFPNIQNYNISICPFEPIDNKALEWYLWRYSPKQYGMNFSSEKANFYWNID